MAVRAGWTDLPFPYVHDLPADNGECFFSEYFQQQKLCSDLQDHPLNDLCPCCECRTNLSTPCTQGPYTTQNTTATTVAQARVVPATRVAPVMPCGVVMHQTHQLLPHVLPIMPLQHVLQRPPGDPFPWHLPQASASSMLYSILQLDYAKRHSEGTSTT